MTAYYNEIDKYAAAWLRNLIAAGHIAPGIVDERSIEDVLPSDLDGFTQCHFFAGIGVWSLALRNAGWPDDRRVWTGSCPCQPFSASGKGAGFADERHLWPAFFHLISECRPATILGEQVASKDADPWIDLVHADVEALGYGFGCVPFPSAGIGAPHIRDRAYWVANANGTGFGARSEGCSPLGYGSPAESDCGAGRLADPSSARSAARISAPTGRHERDAGVADDGGRELPGAGLGPEAGRHAAGGMADANSQQRPVGQSAVGHVDAAGGREQGAATTAGLCNYSRPGPINGFWGTADWLLFRDGKWRPVEPGTFPLAHGAPARVGRLRAYGNAINAEAARVFIESTGLV